MPKSIAFIGSNARSLYVHNIYQCLAYQGKQVIQYRYQIQYVDKDIVKNPKKYINKKGVVIYFYRPNLENSYKGTIEDCTEEVVLPIREVTIKQIEINKEVNHVNFFLELENFIEFEDNISPVIKSYVKKNIFAKSFSYVSLKNVKWLEKIESVKNYFEDIQFFHINNIKGKKLNIEYDYQVNKTSLSLYDDSSYIFEFLTYDKTEGNSHIVIDTDKDYIKVNDNLERGTRVNSKKIKFETKSIDFKRDSTSISFKDENNKFPVNISVRIRKRMKKSVLWGVFSALLLLFVPFTNLYVKSKINTESLTVLFLSFITLSLIIGYLHRNYNKN